MLYEIKNRFLFSEIRDIKGPVVSLYQSTHRLNEGNKQNFIVYKNLLRELKETLVKNYDQDNIDALMNPLYLLEKDTFFWDKVNKGIAILASIDKCFVYNLHSSVKSKVYVGELFHISPLLYAFQSMTDYQVLGLSRNHFELFQWNRNEIFKIEMDSKADLTRDAVLGKQHTDSYFSQGSFGGVGSPSIQISNTDKKEEYDRDTEKYFRFIDRYVFENISKKSECPLILVSVSEHHSLFKDISHNPYLIEQVIDASCESLNLNDLKKRVTEIIDKLDEEKVMSMINTYQNLISEHRCSSNLDEVVKAAKIGKIDVLMVEIDRDVLNPEDDLNSTKNNLLDDLVETVLINNGKVWMLHKEQIPSITGIAAIYRYE